MVTTPAKSLGLEGRWICDAEEAGLAAERKAWG